MLSYLDSGLKIIQEYGMTYKECGYDFLIKDGDGISFILTNELIEDNQALIGFLDRIKD